MLFKFQSYLKFLLKSTNEHGVHSPFIFNYLTKCLYKKPRKSKSKTLDILIKSINYFGFDNINITGNASYKKELQEHFSNLNFDSPIIDILFLETSRNLETVFSEHEFHNDSLIVFNEIHRSKSEFVSWSNFIKFEKITVSIDLYYCGLIFIRKEQRKEHFFIQI